MRGGTEIGRVRGLGAAKAGVQHWWLQRLTAIANFLLVVWLIASLVRLPGYAHATMTAWLKQPLVAAPMLLLVVSLFWHLRLGLQVLIEDYVHDAGARIAALVALNFFAAAGALVGVLAIFKIALG